MTTRVSVAVVGLGKIGLPLAAQFASRGASVIGSDTDAAVVAAVNDGACPVAGEPGLEEALAAARTAGLLRATTDTTAAVRDSDVTVVIVPVGIDDERRADYWHLDAAANAVGRGLVAGRLVVLESTVPVGATRRRFGRGLGLASGLSPGEFRLAYSPERVSSGTVFRDLATYPKLVGGVDLESGAAAAELYRRVLDAEIMLLPDAETAEFAKLAESIYRDLNIALANELARAAEGLGIDYAAAARAANSQPYSHLHTPGVGVGGHCIPVYPYFLLETSPDQRLVSLGRQVNDAMAEHALQRLEKALGSLEGKTVVVLGLAYRGGVKEAKHSSALLLVDGLRRRGGRALVHDPLFSDDEMRALGLEPTRLPLPALADAAILQAMHAEYASLDPRALSGCRVFLDGRGGFDRRRVEEAGMAYLAIGLGR